MEALESSPRAPLLHRQERSHSSDREVTEQGCFKGDIIEEVKRQLGLALPLITVSILQYCLQIISIMFVGHLGELPLSSASMATFASVTGFSVLAIFAVVLCFVPISDAVSQYMISVSYLLLGMGSALETLCGQAYGAKQYHMLGIYTQRGVLVLLVLSIILAFIWFYTDNILLVLGQDQDISVEAGKFNRSMIPALFAYALLQCLNRFLQTQNIVFPMMMSSGFTALLHIILCWLLVFKVGFGSRGAALANAVSYWVNVLLLTVYIKFSPACSMSWTGFSKEALHDILGFLKLAIPSAIMIWQV